GAASSCTAAAVPDPTTAGAPAPGPAVRSSPAAAPAPWWSSPLLGDGSNGRVGSSATIVPEPPVWSAAPPVASTTGSVPSGHTATAPYANQSARRAVSPTSCWSVRAVSHIATAAICPSHGSWVRSHAPMATVCATVDTSPTGASPFSRVQVPVLYW